jgi:membrane protein
MPKLPAPAGHTHRSPLRAAKDFYWKAYEENITGLAGMVAYNLLLSLFPLALLALFIAGQVLQSSDLESSVLRDLARIFPNATDKELIDALDRVRGSTTGFGVIALVASIWIGSSFWGALDTAFCRIYHVNCRSWVEQKRFALAMLVVVLLFIAATVSVPALQSLLVASTDDLPLGLSEVGGLVYAVTLVAGIVLLFGILCLIYWTVPNRPVPWRAIWPGALAATVAISVVDYAFPAYLSSISTLAQFGTIFAFVLIVLIWFYALAIILLGGATLNAMRFEIHDTGELATRNGPAATGDND